MLTGFRANEETLTPTLSRRRGSLPDARDGTNRTNRTNKTVMLFGLEKAERIFQMFKL